MSQKITMRSMFEAGVHFGHHTQYWNPKMAPFIYTAREKVHIINLEKTLPMYHKAVDFLANVAAKNGRILFVGTKPAARRAIVSAAEACEMPYVNYRWLGGMLTNYSTIRQSVKRLENLEQLKNSPKFGQLVKKETLSIERKIDKLQLSLGGIRKLKGLPDALFIIDVGFENIAIQEARRLGIPVVGIVDTNNKLDGVDYPIPGNDDSAKAIELYLDGVVQAVTKAKQDAQRAAVAKEQSSKKAAAEKEAAAQAAPVEDAANAADKSAGASE